MQIQAYQLRPAAEADNSRAMSGRRRFTTKTLRVMKLTALLLLTFSLHLSAHTRAQEITLSAKELSLEQIFTAIEKQTGYVVMYNYDILGKTRPVSIHCRAMPLNKFMEQLLEGQPLDFSIKNTTIFIREKKPAIPVADSASEAPRYLGITGTIINEQTKEPLAGATISLKSGKITVTSNAQGRFTINAAEGDILLISFVGYTTREIRINKTDLGLIALQPTASSLLEVVVNKGYYSESRRLSTGSVGRVTGEEISRQPVTNSLAALDGRVPGLVVTQTTGIPGGTFKVEVRGRTAIDRNITDDQPLFIVDGVPLAANNGYTNLLTSALGYPLNINTSNLAGGVSPLNGINPRDIESIEVLKDADATAIYGSRGANGVVLITTKKGGSGKTKLDLSAYTGVNASAATINMMNTEQYLAMRHAAFNYDGKSPDEYSWFNYYNAYDLKIWDTTRYTNFFDLLNKNTAGTSDVQLAISGGNTQTQYRIGGGYHQESSVMPGNRGYNRSNIIFSINHASLDQRFRISLSGTYSMDRNDLVSSDPASNINLPPNLQIYDSLGNLAWNEKGITAGLAGVKNPLALLNQDYKATTNSLLGNIQLSYAILPSLIVRTSLGYNAVNSNEQIFIPATAQNPDYAPTRTSEKGKNQLNSWIVEPQLEYTTGIGAGKLSALAGASWQATDNDGLRVYASGYSSDALLRSMSGAASYTSTSSISQYRYNAFFGRLNYNWENKYILNLTGRRDGSSRFATENRFANFGAAGLAWIFTNESFMANALPFLSFGKLRGSYGITGNDKITNYQYLDTWVPTATNYNALPGLYPRKLYNPDYVWEKTKKLEAALELGFLQDRLLFSATWYRGRSSNQLVNYRLPYTTGFNSIVANLPALVENAGWELTLNTRNINTKNFKWTTSFNISIPKNKLISFPDLANSTYASTYVEGESLNLIYKYRYTGVDPETGIYTFEDVDKSNSLGVADYQVLGNLDPKFYGGIQNSISFKGFQLDFFFSFRKQTGTSFLGSINAPPGNIANLPTAMTDFWNAPGQHATYQRLSQEYGTDAYNAWYNFASYSDGIYSDASFVRLKNLSLSWSLPELLISRLHLSAFRVYVQGQNLLTITGYELGDPETQRYTRTPPVKTFTAGLQLSL